MNIDQLSSIARIVIWVNKVLVYIIEYAHISIHEGTMVHLHEKSFALVMNLRRNAWRLL